VPRKKSNTRKRLKDNGENTAPKRQSRSSPSDDFPVSPISNTSSHPLEANQQPTIPQDDQDAGNTPKLTSLDFSGNRNKTVPYFIPDARFSTFRRPILTKRNR